MARTFFYFHRRRSLGHLAALCLSALLSACTGPGPEEAAAIGERIYTHGVLPSGQLLQGRTQGDIGFSSAQISCMNCHRRSSYGSSEGGNYVLPVTGPALFQPRTLDRADLLKKLYKEVQPKPFWSRMRSPHMRPAYTEETLARAIRDGVDPAGRTLDPLMPRYHLSDAEMAFLIAYLQSLSTQGDPGVNNKTINFATIVSENADAGQRQAMLSVLEEFVQWINIDTAGDLRNPNFSPRYRTDMVKAYRTWQLDLWELGDNPGSWEEELNAYYNQRPVFAVISGLVDGNWQTIGRFCEQNKLPCLFPNTELPATLENNVYTAYFNAGLPLEAKVIGRYLPKEQPATLPQRVLQLYSDQPKGTEPANALASLLSASDALLLEQHSFSNEATLRSQLEQHTDDDPPLDTVNVWPGDHSQASWALLAQHSSVAQRFFLPVSALETLPDSLPSKLATKLCFSYPYEVPGAYHPRAFRVRAWMRTRGLDITHPRLQFNTYYALTMVQYGLEHIVDHFSRDYLFEYIEHEAENALNPGTFPRLSLGPGQRYASKGTFIVRLDPAHRHKIKPLSGWIVP